MAKDFSFPFYINNWIGGVMYYNFEQKGAYLELLLLQFNHGKFTETQVKQVLNTSYSNVWETIKEKFQTDGTFFWNEKMEEVKENRKAFTESRRNNRLGKTKEVTSEKLVNNTSKTLEQLVESENESKDNSIVDIKVEKFNFKNSLINLGFDEQLVSDWLVVRKTKRGANTETALKQFLSEIEKSKLDKNLVLKHCVVKSWVSFNHTWELPQETKQEAKTGKVDFVIKGNWNA